MTIRELLPLHVLGALDPDEATAVERAVASDPTLAAELDAYRDATHLLAAVAVPVAPSPEVRTRLLASVGGGRFERFSTRLAKLVDVSVDRARELLGLVERAASWELPAPGVGLVHFDGGPACATADCGFIRITAGCTFPWHTHRGEEVSVILEGTLQSDGRLYHPGDELVQPAGSQHDLTTDGGKDVLFVACAQLGIDVTPRP